MKRRENSRFRLKTMWNECKRGLIDLPDSPCKCAIKKILSLSDGQSLVPNHTLTPEEIKDPNLPPCTWYIVDEDSDFCYFKWESNPINQTDHTLEMTSILLGVSIMDVFNCEQNAKKKGLKKLKEIG